MCNNKGFTLIELVIVIIILGMLSATAIPKFINLQSDANISVLEGAQAAMSSADSLVYSLASLRGLENEQNGSNATIQINGNTVSLRSGHPLMWTQSIPNIMETSLNYINTSRNSTDEAVHNGVIFYHGKKLDSNTDVIADACFLHVSNDINKGFLIYDLVKDRC